VSLLSRGSCLAGDHSPSCGQFGQRRYASLGSLLSHALSSWHEHGDFALSEVMRGYLDQRDLYARLSIKALMPQQQADLLAWAEAHTVLAFIARDGLLERFAAHSAEPWAALCSLSAIACRCGCVDESRYALVTDPKKLLLLVEETASTAAKLLKLLSWCANPLQGGATCRGTRLRTADDDDADESVERVRVVKVRFGGSIWERTIDWEELALVREPSPGRDKGSAYPTPILPF
jgi:hypothetical protein